MFHQEINLYQSFESPPPMSSIMTWKIFWLCNAAFVSLFVLTYCFSLSHKIYLKHYANQLAQQEAELQKEFYAIKNQYPAFFFNKDLPQSIDQLRQALATQQKILYSIINSEPFSHYLLKLGEIITPNVWLTHIIITNDGNRMILDGQALNKNVLQIFLNSMALEKMFAGFSLDIKNSDNGLKDDLANTLKFEITIEKKPHE